MLDFHKIYRIQRRTLIRYIRPKALDTYRKLRILRQTGNDLVNIPTRHDPLQGPAEIYIIEL